MRSPLLPAAACLFAILPAAADELPKRKAGLWEINMAVEGRNLPLRNVRQCTDAETDTLMMTNVTGAVGEACAKVEIANSGGTITINSACTFSGATTHSQAVITGDFNSAYTVNVTSKRSGGAPLPHLPSDGTMQMTLQAKWVGPCEAGQRPGDIIMPGGIKINVRELKIRPGTTKR